MNIIPNMPSAEYHAHPAVSKSVLDKIAITPMHCRAYLDGVRTEPTPAMQFGTALHTAVLEPHLFRDQYAVFDGDRRTKEGKATYEALLSSGKQIIKADDRDAIRTMFAHTRWLLTCCLSAAPSTRCSGRIRRPASTASAGLTGCATTASSST
jgi:hypothetical protein